MDDQYKYIVISKFGFDSEVSKKTVAIVEASNSTLQGAVAGMLRKDGYVYDIYKRIDWKVEEK